MFSLYYYFKLRVNVLKDKKVPLIITTLLMFNTTTALHANNTINNIPAQVVGVNAVNNLNDHKDERICSNHKFLKKVIDAYVDVLNTIKIEKGFKKLQLSDRSSANTIVTLKTKKINDKYLLITLKESSGTNIKTKSLKTSIYNSLNSNNFLNKLENTE